MISLCSERISQKSRDRGILCRINVILKFEEVYLEELMIIERFTPAPQEAIEVRTEVFVHEQGFRDEFDDIDAIAMHFVVFDEAESPIGTCRVFTSEDAQVYFLGRLALCYI